MEKEALIDQKLLDRMASSTVTMPMVADAMRDLARQAKDMNAATVDASFGYLNEDEQCAGEYAPRLILRVERINN